VVGHGPIVVDGDAAGGGVWQPSCIVSAPARTLRLGASEFPVVLPTLRDPRLHVAAVIVSIHVLGQTALGFRVSVPQILAAILTCAVIEVGWTFARSRRIVWPASAMLTGSGVALILRLVGAERGDPWSWEGWAVFAGVAGLSLLSKYLIQFRGSHVFNPSNLGLVLTFLVLGSTVVEPLDFWWAPLDPWMGTAYALIVVGGLLVTRRLGLSALAVTFWTVFALALGVLAASGHCITAAWALAPVCGLDFWWVVVSSPELLVFLFFMITDPKTVPEGRHARLLFAAVLALACVLLMAPAATEYGAKVGLLGGLVLLTPLRYWLDRVGARVVGMTGVSTPRLFTRGAVVGAGLVVVGVVLVAAGSPARTSAPVAADRSPVDVDIDEGSLPAVSVSADAAALGEDVTGDPGRVAVALAESLALEEEAIVSGDSSLLRAADGGQRLVEMERRLEESATSGRPTVARHTFETLRLDVVHVEGPQGGASLALHATGTVERITFGPDGEELGREAGPLASTFVLHRTDDGAWVIVSEEESG
jgi:hypothetical protein